MKTAWERLWTVAQSWRLLSVTLIAFTGAMPLGIVWVAIPTWLARAGFDIKTVGFITLAQAPWTFKFLWAPFMDRWAPPWLGRKRGWMLLAQAALSLGTLALAWTAVPPLDVATIGLVALAIAFASASHDIAYDAYAVEVLRREEQGLASGTRNAFARSGLFLAGRVSITAAAAWGWSSVYGALALLMTPAMLITAKSPEPEERVVSPTTMREAVWQPFVGLMAQRRSLEILAFVVLYKLSDNLTQALTGPFLVKMGFDDTDVGVNVGLVSLVATIVGALLGALGIERWGLGRSLWIFGFLQIFSNLGYAVVAQAGHNRPVMFAAVAFELGTASMGSGAFGMLLLRLTAKRFSAAQYALLSSLFAVPRVFSGPVAGVLVDAMGWRDFFVLTILTGIPGMVMLQRFVPWGAAEPELGESETLRGAPVSRPALVALATTSGAAAFVLAVGSAALVEALRRFRREHVFTFVSPLVDVLTPQGTDAWLTLAGCLLFAVLTALATAALVAARRGVASPVV